MATLREYFDYDFNSALRVSFRLQEIRAEEVDAAILYDFSTCLGFIACYVKGGRHSLDYFVKILEAMEHGKSQVILDGRFTLPTIRSMPGTLFFKHANPPIIRAQFFGDPEWISASDVAISNRVFIYAETQLPDNDIIQLKAKGRELGQQVQFRSLNHAQERSKLETPLAFISHDSRDKDVVARPIASGLQGLMCPVWYDEYSLKVGDNLRTSIEAGLKSCHKCILVLSPHFLSNGGWTKKEFDAVFTREILEKRQVVLPVWHGVTSQMVYEYSPSLLNIKGVDWKTLGSNEVVRQLANVILGREG